MPTHGKLRRAEDDRDFVVDGDKLLLFNVLSFAIGFLLSGVQS
ncbi:hypothetical protein MPER_07894 [Moniliophthora perniciosa FA553]|nr:hypothetical protein MPER_07894 [Moniliophthora perniciosa FA553]